MRITEYPRVNSLVPNNVLPIDGPDGTKGILASDLIAPEMHRSIFRGKNLGSNVTSSQLAAIRNSTFEDLFVGDYWVETWFETQYGTPITRRWRIVDINYWLNCGDEEFTTPHLVIMPDDYLKILPMNPTNTTVGGYAGSSFRTTDSGPIQSLIFPVFGNILLTKRSYFDNAVTNGKPSAGAFFDSDIDLPNEINMYGSSIFRPANDGITHPDNFTIDKTQFSLFAICPRFIIAKRGIIGPGGENFTRQSMWLRDPVSATHFALVNHGGVANRASASYSSGIRPCFAIG